MTIAAPTAKISAINQAGCRLPVSTWQIKIEKPVDKSKAQPDHNNIVNAAILIQSTIRKAGEGSFFGYKTPNRSN